MNGTEIKKEYISINEAAKITGLSLQTIRKIGDKKQIQCFTPFLISNAHFEMRFINKMRKGVKWANLPITSTTITIISTTIITTAIFITTIVIITIHKSMITTLALYS